MMDLKFYSCYCLVEISVTKYPGTIPRWTSVGRTSEDACALAKWVEEVPELRLTPDLLEHVLVSIPIGLVSSIPTQLEEARTLQFYAV